jgi:WD40 repeat protein
MNCVNAVVTMELDGRPFVVSGSGSAVGEFSSDYTPDNTVWMWELATGSARQSPRRTKVEFSSWVTALAAVQANGQTMVAVGCKDGSLSTWDIPGIRRLGGRQTADNAPVKAVAFLGADHLVVGAGRLLTIYRNPALTELTQSIELHSEINALVTDGTSTVVAATHHGVVAIDLYGMTEGLLGGTLP